MSEIYHIPVLLNKSIDGLNIKPDGVYVDVTFGGGGHSAEILSRLGANGRLVAFDQDVDAARNLIDDDRLIFVQHNFKYLKNFLRYYNIDKVDGVLADLGVSSHDFDVPKRGFSFRFEGDLDMRMNLSASQSAANVVMEYEENKLVSLFRIYGELKNARKIASLIVSKRTQQKIITTSDLCDVLAELAPKHAEHKFFAKVFQALRIEVNKELDVLKDLLVDVASVLEQGGRMSVISYHSLEDRLVKNFIQKGNFEGKAETDFYGNMNLPLKAIGKIILPDDGEIERNPRSRSAKLRVAEKN